MKEKRKKKEIKKDKERKREKKEIKRKKKERKKRKRMKEGKKERKKKKEKRKKEIRGYVTIRNIVVPVPSSKYYYCSIGMTMCLHSKYLQLLHNDPASHPGRLAQLLQQQS